MSNTDTPNTNLPNAATLLAFASMQRAARRPQISHPDSLKNHLPVQAALFCRQPALLN